MKRTIAAIRALAIVVLMLAWCTTLVGAQDGSLAIVTLYDRPIVRGGEITLGDIAHVQTENTHLKNALENVSVGRAALPGDSRRLSIGTLKLRMRQANIPESMIEIVSERDPFEVWTGYDTVERDDLARLIRERFESTFEIPDGAELDLTVDVGEQKVPVGQVEIRIGMDNFRWGKMAIPVDLFVDGVFYKRIMARAEAWVWQDVWVSQKNHLRGQPIHLTDVTLARRRMPAPVQGPGLDFKPLRTTRYIREGTVLTWNVVEPLPQLLKGDQVTVIARFRTVTLELVGEALADGWVGGQVPILNPESGNTFWGRLNHDGTVLVEVG